jgi:carbamoyltransferase
MLTLGLAGGLDPAHDQILDMPENYTYDGAAVLVRNGEIVAATEEERHNRIKHSNKFPLESIRFCLDQCGLTAQDIDIFAYYVAEDAANALLTRLYLSRPDLPFRVDARTMMSGALSMSLGCEIGPDRVAFYPHKLTHAASAIGNSGFATSLVYVVDTVGGLFEASWSDRGEVRLDDLVAIPASKSMNLLWQTVLPFLGFGLFDEHRAVALAGYGDPDAFRPIFDGLYELLPDGDYALNPQRVALLVGKIEPRRRQEPPGQAHKDLAASLQHTTEEIVLHVLRHYREKTGQRNLCLAGGMIENTSVSGKVLRSDLFDEVFVHPAAYDTGCAVGAALLAASEVGDRLRRERVPHVYWGTDIGPETEVSAELERWQGFLGFERSPDIVGRTAELLASGAVLGWVQGRAEFGSHPLGNRSILADPRPEDMRERVSAATGRLEPYRAFAPSVPEERAGDFFELPTGPLPFMTFAVDVHEDKRAQLPSVTHVDGTARPHTVSQRANPRFWALLNAFGELTDVPVLLNTSFNNNVEPTVDSVTDAVVCFLTTGLDYLVVGDLLIHREEPGPADWFRLEISLPPYVKLFCVKGHTEREQMTSRHEIRTSYDPPVRRKISPELGALLGTLDRPATVGELLARGPGAEVALAELRELWSERLVRITAPDAPPEALS